MSWEDCRGAGEWEADAWNAPEQNLPLLLWLRDFGDLT